MDEVLKTITDSKTVALVPSKIAGVDSFAAAVGLYYALLDAGKDVYFVYPGVVPIAGAGLIEDDRIISNVKERELLISIDYTGTNAAAAHYSTEGDVLQIKIGPVSKDFPASEKVSAKLVGFDFDAIVVLGAQSFEDLGGTFDQLRESFQDAKVINIDNTKRNSNYGDLNLIDSEQTSLSQLIFNAIAKWQFPLGEKAAKALLTGMTYRNASITTSNLPVVRLENPQKS